MPSLGGLHKEGETNPPETRALCEGCVVRLMTKSDPRAGNCCVGCSAMFDCCSHSTETKKRFILWQVISWTKQVIKKYMSPMDSSALKMHTWTRMLLKKKILKPTVTY